MREHSRKGDGYQVKREQMIQEASEHLKKQNEKKMERQKQVEKVQLQRLNSIKECVFRK